MTLSLISGANKGIGLEIARGLARAGHHVLIGCRDGAAGEAAAAAIRAAGGHADPLSLDVTNDASIAAAAASIADRFGRLDVLVNNAGTALDGRSPDAPLRSVFRDTFEVNVFGVACLTEAMAPLLAKSGHGRIVNVSSGLGSLALAVDPASPYAGVKPPAYNSSKAAVNMLTVIYAARYRGQGIKVNAVDPGYCATDLNGHSGPRTAAQGAIAAIRMATLPDDGPTGGYFSEDGPVPCDRRRVLTMRCHEDDIDRLTPEEIRANCVADPGYVAELDDFGYTPLIGACDRGSTAVARVLVEAGADPNFTADDGETPLKAAIPRCGEPFDRSLFDLLLDAGATPNAGYEPPLHIAVGRGHRALVAYLIGRGADPNLEDGDGDPPLFRAGTYGRPGPDLEMMRLLVAHGADVTRRNGIGQTLGNRIGPYALRQITEPTDR